jgi:hypothetical protein
LLESGYRHLPDELLLKQCRFEAFRGPGPGGQKRNKTSSAVRLTHAPTGISVIAGESRSQHSNRAAALKRLRHRLVLQTREPFNASPPELASLDLNLSPRSDRYLAVMGLVLDALSAFAWSVSESAAALGITTGKLVAFLRRDEKLWIEVNRHRMEAGLRLLVGGR